MILQQNRPEALPETVHVPVTVMPSLWPQDRREETSEAQGEPASPRLLRPRVGKGGGAGRKPPQPAAQTTPDHQDVAGWPSEAVPGQRPRAGRRAPGKAPLLTAAFLTCGLIDANQEASK